MPVLTGYLCGRGNATVAGAKAEEAMIDGEREWIAAARYARRIGGGAFYVASSLVQYESNQKK